MAREKDDAMDVFVYLILSLPIVFAVFFTQTFCDYIEFLVNLHLKVNKLILVRLEHERRQSPRSMLESGGEN